MLHHCLLGVLYILWCSTTPSQSLRSILLEPGSTQNEKNANIDGKKYLFKSLRDKRTTKVDCRFLAQCGDAYLYLSDCPGIERSAYLMQNGEIIDIGGDADQSPLANGRKSIKKGKSKKFFSANETEFINLSENITNNSGNWNGKGKRGIACDPTAPYYLTVALYISGRFFESFLDQYGPISAYDQLDDYLEAMIDMTQIIFKRPELNPTVELKVNIVAVWTPESQPVEIELLVGTDTTIIGPVLSSFCAYAKPHILGYDVAVLLERRDDGQNVGGLANFQRACTSSACTYVSPSYNGFEAAFIMAHEIGHVLGMPHDSSVGFPDDTGIMGFYIGSGSVIQWTSCSRDSLNAYSDMLTGNDANCLCTPFDLDPINTLPGQAYPLEEECIHRLGPCTRGNYDEISVCDEISCKQGFLSITRLPQFRLDGSSCGSDAVCQSGQCVSVSAATSGAVTSLSPVNGGWASWNSCEIKHECAACSSCVADGVLPLRLDVRTCTNPPPNNNGMDCSGSHLRGVVCGSSCASSTQLLSYVASELCPSGTNSASAFSSCLSKCFNAADQFVGYAISPNGAPCSGSGRCVAGSCFSACASYPSYYVSSLSDCPVATVETSACACFDCLNGGTCVEVNGTEGQINSTQGLCLCPVTHTGKFCEENKSTPCFPSPCQNGGTCVLSGDPVGTEYTCLCPECVVGTNCQQDNTKCMCPPSARRLEGETCAAAVPPPLG